MLMIGIPVGFTLVKFNLGALLHSIGERLPNEWIPDTACPRFPEVEPPQAEAKNDGPNGKASQTKGISVPNRGVIKAPNGGNETSIISFMSLKSTLAANQESSPEGGTGPQSNPMTTTLEQDNQVAGRTRHFENGISKYAILNYTISAFAISIYY
ncbi:hypothetical protein DSO57_1036436 [Entomophthora muscae]|uniref:Uncharacterized protein n=1 Tax=Entomophthora muscae TaxID=34485 RepID=A0ACC2RQ95_9FUNG|nr:hypothetical protein DSO57_1036436 [Entomophthora muscae]